MRRSLIPIVSVIIPTTLRPEVTAAVASTHGQGVATEVILVVDGVAAELSADLRAVLTPSDRVLHTGGKGAAYARNAGVRAARGDWIAFLDDDDEWLPRKLTRQVEAARDARWSHAHVVVCSQARQRWIGRADLSAPVPARVYGGGVPIADFLFLRRTPTVGRAAVFPSTLLADRELALKVPWDESLPRHQDWDWLIRAAKVESTIVVQLAEALCTVTVGSAGSISATSDWEASLAWAHRLRDESSRRTYVDFVAGQVLRFALQSRSLRGSVACLRVFIRHGPPSPQAFALGLTGVLSRKTAERAMHSLSRVRRTKSPTL